MYSDGMEVNPVCISCGEFNTIGLFDCKCINCGTIMKKSYSFPTYPDFKIINNKLYYYNQLTETISEIAEYIELSAHIRKFRVQKSWGIADDNNTLILLPKYDSLEIDEYGNIHITYPVIKTDLGFLSPCCEIDIMGNPIYRFYNEKEENMEIVTFRNIDAICEWKGDFAISIKGKKKGIVHKNGTTIIEPIFDDVEQGYNNVYAYKNDCDYGFNILLGTYGDGLICVEEHQNTSQGRRRVQFFVNKDFNKVLVFDEIWARRNNIDLDRFHISHHALCHFEKGVLEIEIADDEYSGQIFEINVNGDCKWVRSVDYKEFGAFDITDHLDYSGYEEVNFYKIDDESFRELLDDESQALSNVD
jgi:hypothetical protein